MNQTHDIPRADLYRLGLPTVDRLFEAFDTLISPEPRAAPFCVIGPTEQELAALAPNLLATIRGNRFGGTSDYALADGPGLILPVNENDGLREVAERYWEWDRDYMIQWRTVIALPPGVRDDLPEHQRRLTEEMRLNLHPTLLLTAALNQENRTLAVLPDSGLSDSVGTRARAALGAATFDRQIGHEDRVAAFRDFLPFKPNAPVVSHSATRRQQVERNWDKWKTWGLHPLFVWSHRVDGGADVSVACLDHSARSYEGVGPEKHGATHLRRLTPAMVRDLHETPGVAEMLARVAYGEAERGDDDVFVPSREVARSGNWGAAEPDRELKGYRGIAFGRGKPLARVGDLCKIEAEADWVPCESHPGVLWFVADGPGVLGCLRRTPEPPVKFGHESDEEFAGRRAAWPPRLLRLTGCEDAEYLWRALSDEVVKETLRCRGAKSYNRPAVPASVLADTLIPWPAATEREAVLKKVALGSQLLLEEGGVRTRLELLVGEAESLTELHEERDEAEMSPREVEDVWDELADGLRALLAELADVAPPPRADAGESSGGESEYPPAPAAYVSRLLEQAAHDAEREKHAIDLLEVTLKLDCAVLLALLREVDPAEVGAVWRKVNGGRSKASPTLGKWAELQRVARKAMRKHRNGDGALPDLRRRAADADAGGSVDKAIEVRNFLAHNYGGHGDAVRSALIAQLLPLVADVQRRSGHLRRHPLIFLEGRSVRRAKTELSLLQLIGDNPVLARHTRDRPRGLEWDRVDESEVFLFYNEPDGLLSLWPWVTVAPDTAGRPVVWLVDTIRDDGRVGYKSPYDPAAGHDADAAEASQVTALLFDA